MRQLILFALFSLMIVSSNCAAENRVWGFWNKWGDQGDGYYLNPIIPADFSDIDCIKVGHDYYAITSTFQFSPGMAIIHSTDLVNWEYCGHAVPDLTQISRELDSQHMNRYARGIWAGTLRYHQGKFYLFFGTPDEGFFMTSASRVEGPWEALTCLLPEAGWDDCSVYWDQDGKSYFIGTHFSDNYKTYIFDMSPDGKRINRQSARLVNEGNGREANKLLKQGDWYYIVFSEYQPGKGRYVMAKRAKAITGPYTEERQLAQPNTEANEPNQGGIIEGGDGKWYFLTHHGTGDWSGRIASLLPVNWEEGWPLIGSQSTREKGGMVWKGKMPSKDKKRRFLRRSDDFSNAVLGIQWEWNYQPRQEMFSLTSRKGWLRLRAFKPLHENDLLSAGNTLTQRSFRTSRNRVTVKMDISAMANGQHAGLCHFSEKHSGLGITKESGALFLEYRKNGDILKKRIELPTVIYLRSEWGLDGLSSYSYSKDGKHFKPFGHCYQLSWGYYRGDRIGIYNFNDKEEKGFVDIDYCHYDLR